jgi:hypothetical protein
MPRLTRRQRRFLQRQEGVVSPACGRRDMRRAGSDSAAPPCCCGRALQQCFLTPSRIGKLGTSRQRVVRPATAQLPKSTLFLENIQPSQLTVPWKTAHFLGPLTLSDSGRLSLWRYRLRKPFCCMKRMHPDSVQTRIPNPQGLIAHRTGSPGQRRASLGRRADPSNLRCKCTYIHQGPTPEQHHISPSPTQPRICKQQEG